MRILFICVFTFCSFIGQSQSPSLSYYHLPDVEYDPNIPTPESFLGYQVGDWHVSHDQLYYYMKDLASRSDRFQLREYARSHENRPLIVITISDPDNLRRIDDIKQSHQDLSDPAKSSSVNIDQLPAILYQGYSIHGNEPSGANAALLVAYYLAAAQGDEVKALLKNVVILFDPSFNPDGLNRFASWANTHKSINRNGDVANREINEAWPGGRTNHYWFDLNRDWLLLTHPESQGRVQTVQDWRPNVLTDHHEMGSNTTFFFMPGLPSRVNPITPWENQKLTGDIGEYHAAALDSIGSLYFSKERYDDYYYGKGSTYLDANGGMGILFEQASSRGHTQETVNGILTFPFTIRNQVITSLSTHRAVTQLRRNLLEFKRNFYQTSLSEADKYNVKAYVFGENEDQYKLQCFLEILDAHKIEYYHCKNDIQAEGYNFNAANSFIVPLKQAQHRMARLLFEKVRSFPDSLFYDVSTWTFPLAFDIQYGEITSPTYQKSIGVQAHAPSQAIETLDKARYAYVIDIRDYFAHKCLNELLNKGMRVKLSDSPIGLEHDGKSKVLPVGSLIVPLYNQLKSPEHIHLMLTDLMNANDVDIYPLSTGNNDKGKDLGSTGNITIEPQKILLLGGSGTTSYEVGEIWHLLDNRFGMEITLTDLSDLGRVNWNDYTTIIMASGSYGGLNKYIDKLSDWVSAGGNLILQRTAINWAHKNKMIEIETKTVVKPEVDPEPSAYGCLEDNLGSRETGGAIIQNVIDLTHPLCYGYTDSDFFSFRKGNDYYEPLSNKYANPVMYTDQALISGYMKKENEVRANGSAGVMVIGKGRGQVICLVDDLNFRGYWYGGTKMFLNAIFFGRVIDSGAKG